MKKFFEELHEAIFKIKDQKIKKQMFFDEQDECKRNLEETIDKSMCGIRGLVIHNYYVRAFRPVYDAWVVEPVIEVYYNGFYREFNDTDHFESFIQSLIDPYNEIICEQVSPTNIEVN